MKQVHFGPNICITDIQQFIQHIPMNNFQIEMTSLGCLLCIFVVKNEQFSMPCRTLNMGLQNVEIQNDLKPFLHKI